MTLRVPLPKFNGHPSFRAYCEDCGGVAAREGIKQGEGERRKWYRPLRPGNRRCTHKHTTTPTCHVQTVGGCAFLSFRRIVLPQMWRFALPGLGNLFLVLLKDTSLVSVIGLQELMRKATIAVGFTREPFTFYLAAASLYLALTVVAMTFLRRAERAAAKGVPEMPE